MKVTTPGRRCAWIFLCGNDRGTELCSVDSAPDGDTPEIGYQVPGRTIEVSVFPGGASILGNETLFGRKCPWPSTQVEGKDVYTMQFSTYSDGADSTPILIVSATERQGYTNPLGVTTYEQPLTRRGRGNRLKGKKIMT